MPGTDLAPAAAVDDSLEALLGEHGGRAGAIYVTALLVLVGGLLAAFTIPVDVDIRAPAMLRPASERQVLRTLTDGIVDRVRSSRGQFVREGDTIVSLRSIESTRLLGDAHLAEREQRAFRRDLRAMLAATEGEVEPSSMLGQLEVPLELSRSRTVVAEVNAEWRQLSLDVDRAAHAVARLRQLAHRGFAAPAELEPAELELARARESRSLALQRRRAQWSAQLAESEQRSRDLQRAIDVASTDKNNRAIVAPIAGTVEELAPLTSESAVRAGDPIATISPDTTLVVEALASPRDAGWVRPGMTVRLLVEGYDVQQWGTVSGVVASVGRDYTVIGDDPVFKVQIRLHRAELRRPDGRVAALTKGLRAQARVVVDRRTIGQMLIHRGREWVDRSTPTPTSRSAR